MIHTCYISKKVRAYSTLLSNTVLSRPLNHYYIDYFVSTWVKWSLRWLCFLQIDTKVFTRKERLYKIGPLYQCMGCNKKCEQEYSCSFAGGGAIIILLWSKFPDVERVSMLKYRIYKTEKDNPK